MASTKVSIPLTAKSFYGPACSIKNFKFTVHVVTKFTILFFYQIVVAFNKCINMFTNLLLTNKYINRPS